MRFSENVAVVTGAGSGIGEATARLLAADGAEVVLVSDTASEIDRVASHLHQQGGKAYGLPANIGQPDAVQGVFDEIKRRSGRLDLVCANAGINGVWAPIEEIADEEWQRTIQTDLTGTFLTIKHAVPLLKRQGGAIVITASVNGTRVFSNSGATAYACAKAGQVALAKMVALELAPAHIRVNVVCPGAIATDIQENTQERDIDQVKTPVEYPKGKIPLTGGQPGDAADVADLVTFLLSDAARHISGTEVWIDGAESLLVG